MNPATPTKTAIKTVLVVDDSPLYRKFARDTLGAAGYRVEVSADVWVAALVNRLRPNLVLMDLDMGSFNNLGATAVKALRKVSYGKKIPIVLYSSTEEEKLARIAPECGADGFIHKDNSPGALIRSVEEFLDGRPVN